MYQKRLNYAVVRFVFTQVELNGTLEGIKRQNVQIETDLREEKAKAEILLTELQNANEVKVYVGKRAYFTAGIKLGSWIASRSKTLTGGNTFCTCGDVCLIFFNKYHHLRCSTI